MAHNTNDISSTVSGMNEEPARARKPSTTLDQEAVRAEKCVEQKKRRAGFKAVLTKRRNELLDLMDRGENVNCVKLKVLDLNEAFEKFVDAHKLYCSYVDGSQSSVELAEYYQQEVVLFNGVNERASGWLTAMACTAVEPIVGPEDSVSLIGTRSRASSGSSSRSRLIEEEAKRKALEAKMSLLSLEQQLAERKFHLKQEEELLKLKTDLAQTVAREQVYARADAVENGDRLVTEDRGRVLPSSVNHHQRSDDFAVREEVPLWYSAEERKTIPANITRDEHPPRVPLWYPPEERKPLPGNIISDGHLNTLVRIQKMQMKCMQNLATQQHQSAMALTLPKPEVPVFSGDPIEYCDFVRAFECLIEARTDSSSSRLYYLVQYTRGEVQELMRSCLPMKPDEGYKEARKLLKGKYGQSYKIAAACVDRVTKGTAIRSEDTKALQNLSVLLISCRNTLNEIGHRSKMENPDSLKGIVERLPYDLRKRWRVTADNISEVQGREICFDDIVNFVEKEARVAAHPLFGNLATKSQEQDKDKKVHKIMPSNRHNFATNACEEDNAVSDLPDAAVPFGRDKNCTMCNSREHKLEECEEFKSRNYAERLKFVRDKALCYNCLTPFHRASRCRRKDTCRDCDQKHSPLLHPPDDASKCNRGLSGESGSTSRASNGLIELEGSICGLTEIARSSIGLPIVPVRVKARGSRDSVVTYAFLDSGSNSTFCTKELLEQLGLEGKKTSLSLTTLEKENSLVESSVVSLEVYDLDEHEFLELSTVFSTPKLPVSVDDIPRQKDIEKWPHLSGINVPQVTAQVGILIGNDNAKALEPREVRQSQRKGPYAVKTIFGWTVNGPLGRGQGEASCKVNFIRGDVLLDQQFQKFMELEFNDSLADTTTQMSQEDRKAITIMEQTTQLNDGHYEIALPWKGYPPSLPNNRPLAEHRLKHLKRRFLKDPGLHGKYATVLEDYVHKGYAEKVPDHALNRSDGFVWYLPHHPVFHPEKPDKTRIVFDCAAKYRNISLNDCLFQGPDLNSTLVGVLTRFRQEPIALMADIESMFNQVRVTPSHCDALRFLWWPERDLDQAPQEFRMKVHLFGGVSSPSCSIYALQRTAEDNKDDFDPATIETVKKNFYVDDCLKSIEDERKAIILSEELRELLSKGGFRLTKWSSNSPQVTASIPESERARSVKDLDLEGMPVERALGINWDMGTDRFGFRIKIKDRPPTRRGILSVVSSVYDPLGFAGPFILPAKALLQDLCRKGLGWDDAIPKQSLDGWQQWLRELPKLTEYAVDRCVKPRSLDEVVSSQLHHFSDASETGYGAVTYLRLADKKGQIHCAFMMAKSRLVPLKSISIPRLELSAATVAIKLDKLMRKELQLPIDTSHFWTDSTTVLKYIRNEDKRFRTFVANRIAMIRDGSEPSQWRHVETKLNPADDASRGLTADAFLTATRWISGPSFLWKSETDWPCPFSDELGVSDGDPEVRKEAKTCATAVDAAAAETDRILERFSSWQKLKKFIAWTLRYRKNLREASKGNCLPTEPKEKSHLKPITVGEMKDAELSIIRYVQRKHFAEEIHSLECARSKGSVMGDDLSPRQTTSSVKKSSSIFQLDPILIDGVLRVGGRLRRSSLSEEAKHQILLPKDHHITRLIIRHYHLLSGHSGREYVLSLLRGKFWVINASSMVRRLLASCFDCRRRQTPVSEQKMADLPQDRVTAGLPPFSNVGVDFFGPFMVKQGRSQVKRYGCIFTCLAIRAVHIEVTHSLDTDSFIDALRRFMARRGKPVLVRSDNGGNFVCGEREIRNGIAQWNQQQISEALLQQDVQWIFNPPAGSHHGGVWERCIRTTRKILTALLREQVLKDEALQTLMCEVEAIINGRPITTVSDDSRDLEALTPNHLLLLRSGAVLPPGVFRKEDSYARRRWRQVQYLADQFWKRWTKEYLPLLQLRQKWNLPRRNLTVDDVILVVDDTSPRSSWPIARVTEVMPGADGCVRRVRVKTKTSELERPVDKCVLLEAAEDVFH